jgi:hypothetical protein
MSQVPIGVGDAEAQARFLANNRDFLLEHPHLQDLLRTVVLRTPEAPPQAEVGRVLGLPDDDPARIAFQDKFIAGMVVFGLGRVIVDDFAEVITLSGNARGIGAYKILRGLYERLVTAAYIAKNRSEARPFAEDEAIKRWKLWQRMLELSPGLKDSLPPEKLATLEADYRSAQAKRPRGQKEWKKANLCDMAKGVDANLYSLYWACYLEPTFHTHATSFGLGARFRRSDEGTNAYQATTEKEARKALRLAHLLVLRLLTLHNDYFKLGLDDKIRPRFVAFQKIWDGPATHTDGG